MAEIDKDYRRDAARVNLRKLLDGKKLGNRITASEIVDATGMQNWQSFRDVIRRWAKHSGFAISAVPNDGYRLGLAADYLDAAEQQRRRQLNSVREEIRLLTRTPTTELDDQGMRRHQFQSRIAQSRYEQAESHEREVRSELKIGPARERVPMRLASPSDAK